MSIVGGRLAAAILKRYEWRDIEAPAGYEGAGKLEALFGPSIWDEFAGKTVIDFGCGFGNEALEIARHGAARVIGLDLQERLLHVAWAQQAKRGIQNCTFAQNCNAQADVILSIDSFEHFSHPNEILREIARLLRPDGKVIISFGPPWYHPKGAHFPLFPWAHLFLTEDSLVRWRSKYKDDGATRFCEEAGGLNQMTLRRFERLIALSPLQIETFEAVPIRALRSLHCRLSREFLSSIVRCTLIHRLRA